MSGLLSCAASFLLYTLHEFGSEIVRERKNNKKEKKRQVETSIFRRPNHLMLPFHGVHVTLQICLLQ